MFGLIGAAFGLGENIAGLKAPKFAQQVTNAENEFNGRVADITARRVRRQNRYELGAQRVQSGAGGGSLLFVAAADSRKARERVSNVHNQEAARRVANTASNPSQAGANSNALGSAFNFAKSLSGAGFF